MTQNNDENSDGRKNDSIPLPLLFSKPQRDQLRISPLGGYLGWRARDDTSGVLNLWVQKRSIQNSSSSSSSSISSSDDLYPPRQVTFETDRDVCLFFFFSTDDQTLVYLREPHHGSELYHLYAIELEEEYDGGSSNGKALPQPRDLITDPKMTCAMGFVGNVQIWTMPHAPRQIYACTNSRGKHLFWDVSLLDLDTLECRVVERNVMSTWYGMIWYMLASMWSVGVAFLTRGWITPAAPLATVQWFPDGDYDFRGRLDVDMANLSGAWSVRPKGRVRQEKKAWKTLQTIPFDDMNMQLIGASGGSGTMMMDFSKRNSDNDKTADMVDVHTCHMAGSDTTSYERFNVETCTHVQRLAKGDKSDITGFVTHPIKRCRQFVLYHYEKPTMELLGEKENLSNNSDDLMCDLKFLRNTFRGMSFSILDRTLDDSTWIIFAESDKGQQVCGDSPSAYFMYSRHPGDSSSQLSTRSIKMAFSPRPELSKYKLGTMTPLHVPARDGQDLLCYLSISSKTPPPSAQHKIPLAVFPHGGPQARDDWGYNPLCQLLANRGMHVLQVNYRGSTGLGTKFMQLGMQGAFATDMQHDIEDAVKHVVNDSKTWNVDPDRVAFVGGSFGGYCSLFAMSFHPGSYKCAVAICPLSVVGAANTDSKKAFRGDPLTARYWKQVYGDAVTSNKDEAISVSPLHHIGKCARDAPILLIHGKDDPRVPISHTDLVFQEMQRIQMKGGQYISFVGEGHGIRKERNMIFMYHAVEIFLCRHLELDTPPPLEDCWTQGHGATILHVGKNKNEKDGDRLEMGGIKFMAEKEENGGKQKLQ